MVVVQTLDPIYVDVNQASGDLLKLKKELAEGKIKATKGEILFSSFSKTVLSIQSPGLFDIV